MVIRVDRLALAKSAYAFVVEGETGEEVFGAVHTSAAEVLRRGSECDRSGFRQIDRLIRCDEDKSGRNGAEDLDVGEYVRHRGGQAA